eukprot:5348163-Pleurochrysis_carterae.AAC.1
MSRIREKSAAALASSSALACCVDKGWSSGGTWRYVTMPSGSSVCEEGSGGFRVGEAHGVSAGHHYGDARWQLVW